MGIGVNRFRVMQDLSNMNKAVTEGPSTQGGQTVKKPTAFPEAEKPDVQKTHYNSRKEFDDAIKNGTAKAGDTYFQNEIMYYVDEIKEDGTHTRHKIGWRKPHTGTHTAE